ncbi:MAG: radical SAM protein, partial [Bacteroidetes bacterium]|nr:radical SAM protein [Bacteroidota bacterium]
MALLQSPYLLYSDGKGNIFEDTTLYALGRTGWDAVEVAVDSWIALPDGGNLYELPDRKGIGLDVLTGELRLCDKGWAV